MDILTLHLLYGTYVKNNDVSVINFDHLFYYIFIRYISGESTLDNRVLQ